MTAKPTVAILEKNDTHKTLHESATYVTKPLEKAKMFHFLNLQVLNGFT